MALRLSAIFVWQSLKSLLPDVSLEPLFYSLIALHFSVDLFQIFYQISGFC